jgi:hypothetical protein
MGSDNVLCPYCGKMHEVTCIMPYKCQRCGGSFLPEKDEDMFGNVFYYGRIVEPEGSTKQI